MATLAIVRRDLVRYIRNPVRTAMLFAIPLMLAAIFALAFGGGGGDQITIRVLLFDEDDSLLSRVLEGAGKSSSGPQQLDVVRVGSEGRAMMERGEASAMVHIPKGFTDDYLAARPTTIEVIKNPSERFLPRVVEEGVGLGAAVLSATSRVFRSELEAISGFVADDEYPEDAAIATVSTGFNRKLRELDRFLAPPVMTLEATAAGDDATGTSRADVLAYFLPGLSMMGILFLAQSATRDILRDREQGLIKHLLTAPVSAADYIRAKALSVVLVTHVGFLVLLLVGIAAGVGWGPAVPVIAMVSASSVMASGVLLLISSLVGSERQGDTLTTIVIMVSAMLGGAFIPLSQMPGFLDPFCAASPVYWAVDGFTSLSVDGGGLGEVVDNLGVLFLLGLVCLIAGTVLIRRRIERGEL